MDCPRCGTPNLRVARFCRRCGQSLPERDAWTLAAMSAHRRTVDAEALRKGEVMDDAWGRANVHLADVIEAFLEAARHFDRKTSIALTGGQKRTYTVAVEGAGVVAAFEVNGPYVRIALRGPRQAVHQVVRRVVARHGEDLFAARDGQWERFLQRTGVDQAENQATLLDLLS